LLNEKCNIKDARVIIEPVINVFLISCFFCNIKNDKITPNKVIGSRFDREKNPLSVELKISEIGFNSRLNEVGLRGKF